MRRVLAIGTGILVLGAIGAMFVVASGLPSFSAANGHWRATEWLVQTAKRRSIVLRGNRLEVPSLDDRALVLQGAGHYQTACRRCHGDPGGGPPVFLREMAPRPPDLLRVSERYSRGELFHIVKHGFKLSGMPGWPAQARDDEVWAMVAWLEALPSATPSQRGRMAGTTGAIPEGNAVPPLVQAQCVRCHGTDGLGGGTGAFPVLAGQQAAYLYRSLQAFAYGTRHSGIMMAVAGELSDAEMQQAAGYYSALPGLSARPATDTATAVTATTDAATTDVATPPGPPATGAAIARAGVPQRKVPACGSCHEQDDVANPAYPRLAGQYPRYLALQLKLFAEQARGGTAYAHLMHHAAQGLTPDDRAALARYFGGR